MVAWGLKPPCFPQFFLKYYYNPLKIKMLVPPLDNRIGLKVEADTTDWVHLITTFCD
jgi:hypothetical protein